MVNYIVQGIRMTGRFFVDELHAIFKDAGVLLMFLLAIVVYPIVYSGAYKKELLRDIPVVVVDMDHSSMSRQYARMIDATELMNVVMKARSMEEAKQAFWDGDVMGVVLVPENFEKKVYKGEQTSVSVYGDASYFLLYKQTLGGALYSNSTFSAGVEVKKLLAKGSRAEQAFKQRDPLSCKKYSLYNPSSGYGSFVMPGMIIVILQQTLLLGIGMMGGTRKERYRNHFSLPVSLRKGEIIPVLFGKAGAYLFIYLLDSIFALIWIYKWFGFPDKGNLLDVFALLVPFFLSVSFLGLAISVLFKKREHSMIFLVFMSPAVLFLSGLSWPASAIPSLLYQLGHIFPSTVMVPAYLRVRTMGVGLEDVAFELFFMLGQTIVYFVLAYFAFRYSLVKASKTQLTT